MAARDLLAFREGCGPLRHRFRLATLSQREIVSGDRYCEVVQPYEGIWIHSTRRRRQGCLRAHLGRRKGGTEQPQRGCQGELRRDKHPWQDVRRKSESRIRSIPSTRRLGASVRRRPTRLIPEPHTQATLSGSFSSNHVSATSVVGKTFIPGVIWSGSPALNARSLTSASCRLGTRGN